MICRTDTGLIFSVSLDDVKAGKVLVTQRRPHIKGALLGYRLTEKALGAPS